MVKYVEHFFSCNYWPIVLLPSFHNWAFLQPERTPPCSVCVGGGSLPNSICSILMLILYYILCAHSILNSSQDNKHRTLLYLFRHPGNRRLRSEAVVQGSCYPCPAGHHDPVGPWVRHICHSHMPEPGIWLGVLVPNILSFPSVPWDKRRGHLTPQCRTVG